MSPLTHLPDIRIMDHCRSIGAIDYCFRYYRSNEVAPIEKLERLTAYRQNQIAKLKHLINQEQAPQLFLEELSQL